jgi:HD-GYP domain-containing protein (c-di-GMP phosphodiesterase class II)
MRGEEIPLLARILQVADIYDALTSERPYKRGMSGERANEILAEETRKGWRDPELVPLFQECVSKAARWEADHREMVLEERCEHARPPFDGDSFQRSLNAMRRFLEE